MITILVGVAPAQLQNILAFYSDFHVNYEEIYGIGHYESFERKKNEIFFLKFQVSDHFLGCVKNYIKRWLHTYTQYRPLS